MGISSNYTFLLKTKGKTNNTGTKTTRMQVKTETKEDNKMESGIELGMEEEKFP